MNKTTNKNPPEMRECAVRLVLNNECRWTGFLSINYSEQLPKAKIGPLVGSAGESHDNAVLGRSAL